MLVAMASSAIPTLAKYFCTFGGSCVNQEGVLVATKNADGFLAIEERMRGSTPVAITPSIGAC